MDDERIKSGELVGIVKGMVTVKDKNGNKFYISKTDERYISGELIYHTAKWCLYNGIIYSKKQLANLFGVTIGLLSYRLQRPYYNVELID